MTSIDLGKITFAICGEYQKQTQYEPLDLVRFCNSTFICKEQTQGNEPTDSQYWDLFVAGVPYLSEKGQMFFKDTLPKTLQVGVDGHFLKVKKGVPSWGKTEMRTGTQVAQLCGGANFGQNGIMLYLMKDGRLFVAGNSTYGGNGLVSGKTGSPVQIGIETENPPQTPFVKVFMGSHTFYALTEDGDVYSWGNNSQGALGHDDTVNRYIAERIDWFYENGFKIKDIVLPSNLRWSYNHVYFITISGRVFSCGNNSTGQLGIGSTTQSNVPVEITGDFENVKSVVSSGDYYASTYLIDENNDLWSWGYNGQGQLGHGNTTQLTVPTKVESISSVQKVVATSGNSTTLGNVPYASAMLLTEDGLVYTAGYNGYGQLGQGDTLNRSVFTILSANHKDIKDIFLAGGVFATAGLLNSENELYLWGYNGYGQLGVGDSTQRTAPNKPEGLFQGNIKKVIISGHYTYIFVIILTQEGELWGAGYGDYGQLGRGTDHPAINNTFAKYTTPQVFGSPQIIDIKTVGYDLSSMVFALLEDGRVLFCGRDTTDLNVGGVYPYASDNISLMKFVLF